MLLTFDIGNTDLHGGVFDDSGTLVTQFRKSSRTRPSPEELGLFMRDLFAFRGIEAEQIAAVGIASVVPDLTPVLAEACREFLARDPLILQVGVKTGLNLRVPEPHTVGADRIASAMGAREAFPQRPLIVVDSGTATTIDALTAQGDYLGGIIAPGIRLGMNALAEQTAKLPPVDLIATPDVLGKTTITQIQRGLFWGQVGLIRECVTRIEREAFAGERATVIATGGAGRLLADAELFDAVEPALVLHGMRVALRLNQT